MPQFHQHFGPACTGKVCNIDCRSNPRNIQQPAQHTSCTTVYVPRMTPFNICQHPSSSGYVPQTPVRQDASIGGIVPTALFLVLGLVALFRLGHKE